ncbi:MAG: hypothetical protein ACI8PZ_004540 [Myxococcota bacterium]|jgi:hypothetical protein
MRLMLDKVASSTRNAAIGRHVVVGLHVPARVGQVIAVRVLDSKDKYNQLETPEGRMCTVHRGDRIAGVLGSRRALRGYTGDVPETVAPGDVLHLLNLGGVIGQCTSWAPEVGPPARVEVLGAVLAFPNPDTRYGVPATIADAPVRPLDVLPALPPVVLVVGTCMHAGKTAAACKLVRAATDRGHRVAVAKVTGVALRRDSLEMTDHGAVAAVTFADAGLPSTCAGDVVAVARGCLAEAASSKPDLLIVELGDGLLGDYGVGDILADIGIRAATRAVVLAANDPVAAWGGIQWLDRWGHTTTVVTGPATDNLAGSAQVAALTGVAAHNARTDTDRFIDVVLDSLELTDRRPHVLRLAPRQAVT